MKTLHIISHTHWDREWYLTFQQFRLKLVHLVDGLLERLDAGPAFRHFMLDGQTIILDDYLQIRPEMAPQLRKYVRSGRLLIGPWHILPDMFLVGPEAHIRNLLQGARTARRFGPKMRVGYIPDPFGHPGQVPQILRGFGIDSACVWRGIADQPAEFWWESPDGSRVLMAYMRDSYSNGAGLVVTQPETFCQQLLAAQASLAAHSAVDDTLIMLGTDHMEPPPGTVEAIAYANRHLPGRRVRHSTLPKYIQAVRKAVRHHALLVVTGELRSCQRSQLLPGVLSSRIWIKQYNQACETLLERWAEPFSTFASLLAAGQGVEEVRTRLPIKIEPTPLLQNPAEVLRYAWRLLMENHPHDSICGCSIDQVHAEMRPRFDQVAQVGEEVARQSLAAIAARVDTRCQGAATAVLVFNPGDTTCTGPVTVDLSLPPGVERFEMRDQAGEVVPLCSEGAEGREVINMLLDRQGLENGLAMIHDGWIAGMAVQAMELARQDDQVSVRLVLSEGGRPDRAAWDSGLKQGQLFLQDPAVNSFHVVARTTAGSQVSWVASQVPPHGWKTYWVWPTPALPDAPPVQLHPLARWVLPLGMRLAGSRLGAWMVGRLGTPKKDKPPYIIQNEFFQVEADPQDGTLVVTDVRSGQDYRGLNRFVDGGEAGDSYNYSPPVGDSFHIARLVSVRVERTPVFQALEIELALEVPAALAPERDRRSAQMVTLPIHSTVRLHPGVACIEVETTVENRAADHRLQVHFPAPFKAEVAQVDGHFEVVHRSLALPEGGPDWAETPRPEFPQRAFTSIQQGGCGLMVANLGLPEAAVLPTSEGNSEIVLTLLRCVGWLSRDDLATRSGHAGPQKAIPEAQMPGSWTFNYALIPHSGDWQQVQPLAQAFVTPLQALPVHNHPGDLPPSGSFLAHTPDAFQLTAIKVCEDGEGWLVRGVNLGSVPLEVTLTPWRPFARAARANMAEAVLEELAVEADGSVRFEAGGHQVVTVRFGS